MESVFPRNIALGAHDWGQVLMKEGMMTEHTSTSLHDLITHTFATIEAKDLEAMMSVFAG